MPEVEALPWPDFSDAAPSGPPLVLLPGSDGWSLEASRAAAALHAVGRSVHAITDGSEDPDVREWLTGIPSTVSAPCSQPARIAQEIRDLMRAGYLSALIGLEPPEVAPAAPGLASPRHGGADSPVMLLSQGPLEAESARDAAALRGSGRRVLLMLSPEDFDREDPWLANVDVAAVSEDGSMRWRAAGAARPVWKTAEQAKRESDLQAESDAIREKAAREKQQQIARQREADQRSRETDQARGRRALELLAAGGSYESIAAKLGLDGADEARRLVDSVSPQTTSPAQTQPTQEPARATAQAPSASVPARGAPAAPTVQCPRCGGTVNLAPKATMAQCGACGAKCALGRCLNCGRIGLSLMDGSHVTCAGCGNVSRVGPDPAETLIRGSGALARIGCGLTGLVWLGIPLLFLLVVVVMTLLSR